MSRHAPCPTEKVPADSALPERRTPGMLPGTHASHRAAVLSRRPVAVRRCVTSAHHGPETTGAPCAVAGQRPPRRQPSPVWACTPRTGRPRSRTGCGAGGGSPGGAAACRPTGHAHPASSRPSRAVNGELAERCPGGERRRAGWRGVAVPGADRLADVAAEQVRRRAAGSSASGNGPRCSMVRYEMQRRASSRPGPSKARVGQASRQAVQVPQWSVSGSSGGSASRGHQLAEEQLAPQPCG